MKLNGLVYLTVAVLVIMAGVIGWNVHKSVTKPKILANPELLQSLQDSVKTVKAELRTAGGMIATLRQAGQARDGKLKLNAATIADLTAKLAKVQGGGPSDDGTGGWRVYQDKFLTAFYKPDSLTYTLEPRPVEISLVEGMDNNWSCYGRDLLADAPAVISSFEVQRNRDWQQARPWYRKLGTVLKYTGVALAAGSLGYVAGKVF